MTIAIIIAFQFIFIVALIVGTSRTAYKADKVVFDAYKKLADMQGELDRANREIEQHRQDLIAVASSGRVGGGSGGV